MVGVPLGLVFGSLVFRAVADGIGAVPDATTSVLLLVAIVAGIVLLANVVALLPAPPGSARVGRPAAAGRVTAGRPPALRP